MLRSRSFPPVVAPDCRVLILGSLPGAASLAAGRYYAHPRNQFWRLTGAVIETDLEAQPYEARLEMLKVAGIGLWDVVHTASRRGSLDSAIRDPQANDLAPLVVGLPHLRAVAFNGASAHSIGSRRLEGRGVALAKLPSSSPAHAGLTFAAKLERWLALRAWL